MRNTPTHKVPPMRSSTIAFLLGAILASFANAAAAADLYVICNSGVTLQPGEVRDVFLGEKGFAGSTKLTPADNSAAQAVFLEKVLKLDAVKYAGIWTKKSFRDGANPPPVKSSDAEAMAFVKATPGACSYLTSEPAGVAVVAKF
jgi:hypothetical protein